MHVLLDDCELVSGDLFYCEYQVAAHFGPSTIVHLWLVDEFGVLGDEVVVWDCGECHCHLFFYGER